MEINLQRSTSTPATAMPISAAEEAPATAAPETSREAQAASEKLLGAAQKLRDAQQARRQAHGQAVRAYADGEPPQALRDALAGAALSDKLDQPREQAAKLALLRLSGEDDATGAPGISPAAARSMPWDWPSNQGNSNNASDTSQGALGDIWRELAAMIGSSEQGDLADYASALDKYTALYQRITNILSQFEKWVTADGDNYMKVDFGKLKNELEVLLKKYDPPSQDQIIAGQPTGSFSEAEAIEVCQKLGLDPNCRYKNYDGTYCVIPDLSQIRKMLSDLPGTGNGHRLSIASYNAWKAGFDSQMSRIEDGLQTRGQKYSNTYSRFENFHKTISSIIQSMADMLRQFLQF